MCKRAPGRSARHHALNDMIARAVASAGIPATKEPQGLSGSDGKRPDDLTLIPWQAGRAMAGMGRHRLLLASRVIRGGSSAGSRRGSRDCGSS